MTNPSEKTPRNTSSEIIDAGGEAVVSYTDVTRNGQDAPESRAKII
jgi:hypothetical protein